MGFAIIPFVFFFSMLTSGGPDVQAEEVTPKAQTVATTPKPELTSWKLVRQKDFPNYKVEIYQRWAMGKFPRIDGMKAKIIPKAGGPATEFFGTWLTPDPRDFVVDWDGKPLDMNGDGLEDLVLRSSTGGVHCCYSYTVFSLGKELKKIGEIDMQDCGEKIRLHDLSGNGRPEILACDAGYTYLGDLPFSDSPFPPAIYALGPNGYELVDKNFPLVYQQDILNQRAVLAKGYRPAAVLQIVTDYFLMGNETKGWEEFNKLYQGKDKEKIKLQLLQKLGLSLPTPETAPANPAAPSASSGPAPAGETL